MRSDRPVPVHMGSPRFAACETRYGLVTRLWFPGGAVLDPHVHDRPTFAVILSGGFELLFTNRALRHTRWSCPPGTILTQPAGEKHTNYISGGGAHGVVLQPDVIGGALPARCVKRLNDIAWFRDAGIGAAARALVRELAIADDLTPLAVESLVLDMLVRAGRLDSATPDDAGEPPPWLLRAVEFAHAHFRERVRIRDIASAAGVHPAHLAATFRHLQRVPIGAYMRRLRVDWAADRLVTTDAPLATIAAEAGFADQAHLTRAFKRGIGATPAEYRRARRPRRREAFIDQIP